MSELNIKSKIYSGLRKIFKLYNKVRFITIVIAVVYAGYLVGLEKDNASFYYLSIDARPLATAFFILGINQILFALAWHFIVISVKKEYKFRDNIIAFSEAQITKILPTPVFFIASRIMFYRGAKAPMQGLEIAYSLSLEAILQILSGIVLLIWLQFGSFSLLTLLTTYVLSTCFLLFFFRISHKLMDNRINLERNPTANILIAWTLLMATWLLSMPFFYLIIKGLLNTTDRSLSFWIIIWKVWITSSLLSYLGSFIGGIGILREASMLLLLRDSFSVTVSLSIAAGSRIFLLLGNLLWSGAILLFAKLVKGRN